MNRILSAFTAAVVLFSCAAIARGESSQTLEAPFSDIDSGFSFAETSFAVSEARRAIDLQVVRSAGVGEASVEYFTTPISATPDVDYTPVAGVLHFGKGETRQSIRVPIANDMLIEQVESFRVVLTNASLGTKLGSPSTASVQIFDNGAGFNIQCSTSDPNCSSPSENGAVNFEVAIAGTVSLTDSVSVEVATFPGLATVGVDYLPWGQTIVFAPGETRKSLSIPLRNNDRIDGDRRRTFFIVLENPRGLPLGPLRTMVVMIQDNERGYWIESSPPDYDALLAAENGGDVQVHVYREGDFNFTSSVQYRTSSAEPAGNPATEGEDYLPTFGTLTFAPGETNKTVVIRMVDDNKIETDEGFWLQLRNPSPGVPGGQDQRWIKIVDNEANPVRVDPDFRPAVPNELSAWPHFLPDLSVLSDGRTVLPTVLWRFTGEDGTGIVRLLASGDLDPGFSIAKVGGMKTLCTLADGQVVVGGGPDLSVNGVSTPQLARLRIDGSLDANFAPHLPRAAEACVTAAAEAPNSGILVAISPNPIIVRLKPDGTVDPTFAQARTVESVTRMVLDNAGRVLLGGGYNLSSVNGRPRPGLARLHPDGTLDEAFLNQWQNPQVQMFAVGPDDSVLVGYGESSAAQFSLTQLTPEGLVDPSFKADMGANVNFFTWTATNKVLVASRPQRIAESGLISRLNSDGSPDETFVPATYTVRFASSGGWVPPAYHLAATPNGDLLVGGDALSVNGKGMPGPVRLLVNAPVPRVEIDAFSAVLIETNGIVNVKLIRTGLTTESLTIHWTTEDSTAIAGNDFVAANGTIMFAAGETSHSIALQLLDNSEPDADRELRLRFSGPGGVDLPSATITIRNDDLGILPGSLFAFRSGRVILTVTGQSGQPNVRIQRSTDLISWQDWTWPNAETKYLDRDVPTTGPAKQFYRMVTD